MGVKEPRKIRITTICLFIAAIIIMGLEYWIYTINNDDASKDKIHNEQGDKIEQLENRIEKLEAEIYRITRNEIT